jgi:hypothetical protein
MKELTVKLEDSYKIITKLKKRVGRGEKNLLELNNLYDEQVRERHALDDEILKSKLENPIQRSHGKVINVKQLK